MLKENTAVLKTALKQGFPSFTIYEERVRQGFTRPCFFLNIKEVASKKEIGNRYLFTVIWEIFCYEKAAGIGDVNHLFRVYHQDAMKLYDILDIPGYITTKMCHQISDDGLLFTLTHSFYEEKEMDQNFYEKMMKLKLEME